MGSDENQWGGVFNCPQLVVMSGEVNKPRLKGKFCCYVPDTIYGANRLARELDEIAFEEEEKILC